MKYAAILQDGRSTLIATLLPEGFQTAATEFKPFANKKEMEDWVLSNLSRPRSSDHGFTIIQYEEMVVKTSVTVERHPGRDNPHGGR